MIYSDLLRAGLSGVRIPSGARNYPLFRKPRQLWCPVCLLFIGYRGTYTGVKRPGGKVDLSPPSSAEVKNEWSYASTPPVCIHESEKDFSFYTCM